MLLHAGYGIRTSLATVTVCSHGPFVSKQMFNSRSITNSLVDWILFNMNLSNKITFRSVSERVLSA